MQVEGVEGLGGTRLSIRGSWFSEAKGWNFLPQMDILRSSLRSQVNEGLEGSKSNSKAMASPEPPQHHADCGHSVTGPQAPRAQRSQLLGSGSQPMPLLPQVWSQGCYTLAPQNNQVKSPSGGGTQLPTACLCPSGPRVSAVMGSGPAQCSREMLLPSALPRRRTEAQSM